MQTFYWSWCLLVALASQAATGFLTAPKVSNSQQCSKQSISLYLASDPKTTTAAPDTTSEEVEPTLELLKAWSLEYFEAARKGGQGAGIEEFADWFAEDFVQTGPDIGPLNKKDYVHALSTYMKTGFDVYKASPDLTASYDGFHIDPHNPWRVWLTVRYIGTHTGTITLPNSDVELKPKPEGQNKIYGGPELYSFWFTPRKQIKWHTTGYVGDRHTGTNQGYGAVVGLMIGMGLPRVAIDLFSPVIQVQTWLSQFGLGDESVPRTRSANGDLPQWWKDRTKSGMNLN